MNDGAGGACPPLEHPPARQRLPPSRAPFFLDYHGHRKDHSAKLGSVVLRVKEKETVYVPIILSAAAIGLGVLLLLVAFRNI